MSDYPNLLRAIANGLWAIEPASAARTLAVLERRLSGVRLSAEERGEVIAQADLQFYAGPMGRDPMTGQPPAPSHVAVMPLTGLMKNRLSSIEQQSGGGGVSTTQFADALYAATNDPTITGICILADSGGGEVAGTPELHAQIAETARVKPVTAFVRGMAGSACYWAISAATEIVASKSSEVGSIGVLSAHDDVSAMMKRLGISTTLLTAGPRKGELSPLGPLSDDAKRNLQARIDSVYRSFLRDVGVARGKSMVEVEKTFGGGGMLDAQTAKAVGAIDRISTWAETLQRVARTRSGQPAAIRPRATTDRPAVAAAHTGMDLETRRRRMAFIARRGA